MATTYGFHSHDGWWFNRADDGTVQVVQTEPTNSDKVLQTVMFDAGTWASIVASVSKDGETAKSYKSALGLHIDGVEDWIDGETLSDTLMFALGAATSENEEERALIRSTFKDMMVKAGVPLDESEAVSARNAEWEADEREFGY